MHHKHCIATGKVYKWKARLNIHGGCQIKGVHYWDTYSPMVHWASIQLALTLSIIHGWHMAQMDCVLAYPQADIKVPLYMEMPCGFKCKDYEPREVILALRKNLYGQKQAGRVWYQHLTRLLTTKHGL